MKIKSYLNAKLFGLFCILFAVNAVFLILYLSYILPQSINAGFIQLKNQLDIEMKSIVKTLSSSDYDSFTETCNKLKISNKMIVRIKDSQDMTVFIYPDEQKLEKIDESDEFYFKYNSVFTLKDKAGGNHSYSIELFSFTPDFDSISGQVVLKLCVFEIVAVIIIILVSTVFINVLILNPINELNKKMRNYNMFKVRKTDRVSEVSQLDEEFNDLVLALEKEKEKQSRMIASVSHDIKTPLTSIMGYTEQLKKEKITDERRKKYIDTIYAKALSIKGMIEGLDDYLSYNNIGSSQKSLKTVRQFFNIISIYYLDELKRNNIKVNLINNCPEEKILVNDDSLIRVIGNLIDNSIKHQSPGRNLELWVESENLGDYIRISFRDNGKGVDEDKLDKIFEPFYTTDESRSSAVSGLGLSICYEIITEHGGMIWAENSEKGGLVIYFTLGKKN